MSRIGTAIILALSRPQGTADFHTDGLDWSGDALSLLKEEYPSFEDWVRGNTVLDFGCGLGLQSIALSKLGAHRVIGLDTNARAIQQATKLAKEAGVDAAVIFTEALPQEYFGSVDVVISQNAMEHFSDPERVLGEMVKALKPDGRLLITFGPPWFAPYGSHMHFFTKIPWVNLFFSESSVMSARARFRGDGASRYEEVESGLNRMTLRKFERILKSKALEPEFLRYRCVKGMDFLAKIPLVRELFVNRVTVSVRRT